MIHQLEKIESERLLLRPLAIEDAPDIQRLAGDYEVARWLEHVPHPYLDGEAEKFINHSSERFRRDEGYAFAVIDRDNGRFVGTIDIRLADMPPGEGAIGYWVGREYHGRGYATEATRLMLGFAVDYLHLDRVVAWALEDNVSSINVLKKCGMRFKGRARKQRDGFDEPVVTERYAVLAKDIRR